MSVALEVRVPPETFALGQVLAAPDPLRLDLERLVPLGADATLFVRASGPEQPAFRESVESDPRVEQFVAVEEREDRTLYRLEWIDEPRGLLVAARESGAVIVRARLDRQWLFRFRFPDHEALSEFHERCEDGDVRLEIERIDSTTDVDGADRFGLSTAQREALVLALERGYFDTPSQVSLEELAEEFDISHQALSSRIRRGQEVILREVLRTPRREDGRVVEEP